MAVHVKCQGFTLQSAKESSILALIQYHVGLTFILDYSPKQKVFL